MRGEAIVVYSNDSKYQTELQLKSMTTKVEVSEGSSSRSKIILGGDVDLVSKAWLKSTSFKGPRYYLHGETEKELWE